MTNNTVKRTASKIDNDIKNLTVSMLKDEGKTNLADLIDKNAVNYQDVMNLYATNNPQGLNTLTSNLYGFIAKQFIKTYDFNNIYGSCFYEGEEIDVGSGFSYIEQYNNTVGLSAPINYQTSTDSTSTIAFGSSFSNGGMINCLCTNLPFNNVNSDIQNWITLNITIPSTFASFSSLNTQKASEILNIYTKNLENSRNLYYYYLGNTLFTWYKENMLLNNWSCTKNAAIDAATLNITYTPPKNLMEALQYEIAPAIEYLKQLRYSLNNGFSCLTHTTWGNNASTPYIEFYESHMDNVANSSANQTWVTYNMSSISDIKPNLKSATEDELKIYMSVNTSIALKTLAATNYLGVEKLNMEFSNNRITKLCGIDVVVVGTNINLPNQTPQGTSVPTGKISNQLLSDNEILILSKECWKFYKYYDKFYKTDTLVQSMVEVGRQQIGFLPFANIWAPGLKLIFDDGVLTTPNYLTVKTLA